jgi:hypothetical protein
MLTIATRILGRARAPAPPCPRFLNPTPGAKNMFYVSGLGRSREPYHRACDGMKARCYDRAFLSGYLVLFFCARGGLLVALAKVHGV